MVRYKKELKKRGFKFNEDFDVLPCVVAGSVLLEDKRLILTPDGFLIISRYDVDVVRRFYNKKFVEIPVLEPEDEIRYRDFEVGSIRIWNDCPNYMFCYDMDDNLRYICFNPYL